MELKEIGLDSYIDELTTQVGGERQRAIDLVENQKRLINRYKEALEGEKIRVSNLDLSQAEQDQLIDKFIFRNSPFLYNKSQTVISKSQPDPETGKVDVIYNQGYYYTAQTPIKQWQDERFDAINNNDEARSFYRSIVDNLNKLYREAPEEVFYELNYNHLPYYPKELMKRLSDDGVFNVSKTSSKIFFDLLTEKGLDNMSSLDRNIKTGQVEYNLVFPSKKYQYLLKLKLKKSNV